MSKKLIIQNKPGDYTITQTGKLEYCRPCGDSPSVYLEGDKLHPAQIGRLRELARALKIVFGDLEINGNYKQILGL